MKKLLASLCIIIICISSINNVEIKGIDDSIELPLAAKEEDISSPDHIIGSGTPQSCSEEAFRKAVALGGTIVFDGGDQPFTLTLTEPVKVFNNQNPDIVIDGGGLVTLSGGNKTRILYMNTCDSDQVWTTPHCQNQDHPRLTVQNITFANGNSINDTTYTGGGAIWVRGGIFKVFNCKFINNECQGSGPDVGGGAIRVFSQYNNHPVYIVNSTFGGGEGLGNIGSNGGAISSIGVSWTIINSVFSHNKAIGNGGNPAVSGSVGGGSGGAIYNDGNMMTLTLINSVVENNSVTTHGSGIFFVTNNHSGNIVLENSLIINNQGGSWYPVYDEISSHSDTDISVSFDESKHTSDQGVDFKLAQPTAFPVFVNGQLTSFESYTIEGYNYFKLRDIAASVSGTQKEFNITWHNTNKLISISSHESYDFVGGELEIPSESNYRKYLVSKPNIEFNQTSVDLNTYLIHNNNFVKLRDICDLLDIKVWWDGEKKEIHIDSSL